MRELLIVKWAEVTNDGLTTCHHRQCDTQRRSLNSLLLLFFLAAILFCPPIQAQQTSTGPIALVGGTIHEMTGTTPYVGTVLIRDGKIAAVGSDVTIPESTRQYDLRGYHVVPGLIDCRSVLWMTDAAAKEKNSKGSLNVLLGIDPWQEDWQEVAAQGVTCVGVQPNSGSSLGGLSVALSVAPSPEEVNDLVLKSPSGLQAAIGLTGDTSRARYTQLNQLKTSIKKVVDGQKASAVASSSPRPNAGARGGRGRFPTPRRGGRRGGGARTPTVTAAVPPDRTDDVLKKVVKEGLPLCIEVHHSDTTRLALQLAKEFEISVVLEGLSHVGDSWNAIAENNLPCIIGPLVETTTVPAYRKDTDLEWLAPFSKANGTWALGTFSENPRGSRSLRAQAAAAVSHGVPADQALRAVTINAARILGLEEQLGTLQVGKRADVAVFAGDPIDPSAPVRLVFSGGKITHDKDVAANETEPVIAASEQKELPATLPASYVIATNRLLRDGNFTPGKIYVRDGKIAATGSTINAPAELETYDVGDSVITPGLVSAHSYLGQESELSDETESDATHLRAVDGVNPQHETAQALMNGGFIHVAVAPGSKNTSAGALGHIRLGAVDYVRQGEIANKFVLAKKARDDNRYPASLTGQQEMLTGLFESRVPKTRLYVSSVVENSLLAQKRRVAEEVLSKQRQALFEVQTPLEASAALKLVAGKKLNATLFGSGYSDHVPEMKSLGVGLIINQSDGGEYQRYFDRLVAAAGHSINVGFAGDSPQRIRLTAALATAAGLPRQVALRGLTTGGAQICGMGNVVEIANGNDADFVIWSGSPLNLASRPLRVIVGGKSVR